MFKSKVDVSSCLQRIWTFLAESSSVLFHTKKNLLLEILGLSFVFFFFVTTHSTLSYGGSCSAGEYKGPYECPLVTSLDSSSSTNVNMGYGGLKWTLGESYVPEIVGGFRYASVTSSGATQGADISIAFKVTGNTDLSNFIQLGKLRAKYLNGIDYLQGEVGGGWDFAKKGVFAGISAQGPYANTGVDYDFANKSTFGKSLSPYVEFNSIGIYNTPDKNQTVTTSCPTSYEFINGICIPALGAPSDRRLKRDIHHLATLKNGMKIYAFKYLTSDKAYVGVMAQDLLQNASWKKAVIQQTNGFYSVNYAMLGLKMTTFAEWKSNGLASIELEKHLVRLTPLPNESQKI
jgi:hypothetical protein